jgi:glycosyltransferase involved in cell wall biosynthesis
MTVLYDHQAFTIQEYGGISRYFYELAKYFHSLEEPTVRSSLLFSNNEYIHEDKIVRSTPFIKCIRSQKKTEAMNLFNEIKSLAVVKSANFDLFHPTYYDPYYLKIKSKKPIVITFHDLIHEKFKQYDGRTLANKKKVLNRADRIIAVSQNSKNDLVEHYGIPKERVVVIHLASSFAPQQIPAIETLKEDYFLYVGNRDHYKNFLFFVRAITPLLREHPKLFLYCVGGGKFTKEESLLFIELRIDRQIKLTSGTDESLKKMYAHAIAFFFPSYYEGFGIPLLEAMNCGCPIAASHTSSLPEVAGNAALYFNPYDKHSILSVAEKLVNDPSIRTDLKAKGFLRAKEFSWQKTATRTHEVYKSLLQ